MRRTGSVVVAAFASHATVLAGGYAWLDHAHLERGAAIAPFGRWLSLFGHGFAGTGYYRPLVALSLSVDALAHSVFVFHLVTLAWHAAAALAVLFAAEALGLARRAAWIGALLFAVHPATSIVAGAIAFRSEAMIAVALLALVAAHARDRPIVAAGAMAAGALTKETALVLGPLFVVALSLEKHERATRLWLAEGIALAAALAMRGFFAPAWRAAHPSLGPNAAIGTRLAAFAKSARTLVIPYDLDVCDAFRVTEAWRPTAVVGAMAVVVVGWLAFRRRGPALLFALSLVPSLQIVPVMRWWSPHYLYVAIAFGAMLVGEVVDRYWSRRFLVAGLVGLGALGVASLVQGTRFRDDLALFGPEAERNPTCREAHFYVGEAARTQRDFERAARHYEAALARDPRVLAFVDRSAASQNLGGVRLEQRRFDDARRAFADALREAPNETTRRELAYDLALATWLSGDSSGATAILDAELARASPMPEVQRLRDRIRQNER